MPRKSRAAMTGKPQLLRTENGMNFHIFLGSAQLRAASFGRIFLLSCRGEFQFSRLIGFNYENLVLHS